MLAVQNVEASGTIGKDQEIEFSALCGSLSMMSKGMSFRLAISIRLPRLLASSSFEWRPRFVCKPLFLILPVLTITYMVYLAIEWILASSNLCQGYVERLPQCTWFTISIPAVCISSSDALAFCALANGHRCQRINSRNALGPQDRHRRLPFLPLFHV